jgi:hypothetical protein
MKLRKLILSLLAILPISSIAFAADFQLNNVDEPKCPEEIEDEFLQRLEDQQLPLKYYRFLRDHKIKSTEELLSEENEKLRKRLIEEYNKDYVAPMGRESGTISIM